MEKELEKKLGEYSEKRANEVDDVDIDELRKLVIDGAKWMLEQLSRCDCKPMECEVDGMRYFKCKKCGISMK